MHTVSICSREICTEYIHIYTYIIQNILNSNFDLCVLKLSEGEFPKLPPPPALVPFFSLLEGGEGRLGPPTDRPVPFTDLYVVFSAYYGMKWTGMDG